MEGHNLQNLHHHHQNPLDCLCNLWVTYHQLWGIVMINRKLLTNQLAWELVPKRLAGR